MAENEQSEADAFSVPTDYARRDGTVDYGKEYEIKLTTLFCLLCAHLDKDMWIGSNVNECGDFDDIVVHRKTKSGKQATIMMQMKHEEKGKHITQQQFYSPKGNFSLQRYSKDLSCMKKAIDDKAKQLSMINHLRLDHEKIFIIFTNKGVYEYDLLSKIEGESDLKVFNINGNVHKFCYDNLPPECSVEENSKAFMNNLYLFTNQPHIQNLDKPITLAMEQLLEPIKLSGKSLVSVVDKFTNFVEDWSKGHLGGHYPLTKAQVMKVLTTFLLEPYETELEEPEEGGVFNTTWDEIISTKSVTLIDADKTAVQFVKQNIHSTVSQLLKDSDMITLWERNRNRINKTMLKVVPRHKQINLYGLYEYLWKNKQVPLLLKTSDTHTLENLQCILKISPGAFCVIITTKFNNKPPHINLNNTFMNLHDLNEDLKQIILECPVKLQGRPCNALHKLVSPEMFKLITVKDIIYVLSGKFNIGRDADPLPECFIDRSIPKVCIKGESLEKVKNDIFIIKCTAVRFKKFRKKHKLHLRKSVRFLKHKTEISSQILSKFRIIVSNRDINIDNIDGDSFGYKAVHYLVLHENSYLEWKKSSGGSVSALRPFRLVNRTPTEKKNAFSNNDDEASASSSDSSDSDSEDSDTKESESEDPESDDSDSEVVKGMEHTETVTDSSNHVQILGCASMTSHLQFYTIKEMLELFSVNVNIIPLIISADPGMGKSVLMDYIALNMPVSMWVVRINLIQFTSYYRRENFNKLKPDDHLHYFNNKFLAESKIACALFQKYLQSKNIILLFDGFDEIPITSRKNVIKIVKGLHDFGYITCLTTRPVAKIQLEEIFNTFAADIVPFSETDQISFLIEYFDTFVKTNVQTKMVAVKAFVQKLLDATKRNINAFDSAFMGVPLQTKLLAEVFINDCEAFLSTGVFGIEHFDILYLYRRFIKKKVKIICDKFGDSSEDEYVRYINYRALLALQLLFEEQDLEDLEIKKHLQLLYEMIPHILQEVQKDGIVIAESEYNIWFVHRTFAEYLSAQWLSENIDGKYKNVVRNLVKKMFLPNYSSVRKLFDRIVTQDCTHHLLLLNGCIDQVKQHILSNRNAMNEVDECGRTLLHLMAFGGVEHPHHLKSPDEFHTINRAVRLDPRANYIKKRTIEINNIKDSLGYTPLDYALFSKCYGTANAICIRLKNVTNYIISNFATDSKLIFEYFENNNFNYRPLTRILFRNLVAADINTAVSNIQHIKEQNNELHCAVVRNIHDLANLLTSAISTDETDSDGHTPLHIGVMLKKREAVSLLLSKDVNINVRDKSGKTALHWASAIGDIHSVNALLSRNVNVNVKDNFGMTSLHYAVTLSSDEQKAIVTALLESEAAIDVRDKYGKTPLEYCVYYSHIDTLNALIDHFTRRSNHTLADNAGGSDYSFNLETLLSSTNSKGETVFHWAADCNLISLLKFLKSHLEFSTMTNDKGNTPLHLATLRGNTESVKLLLSNSNTLESEQDPNTVINMQGSNQASSSSPSLKSAPEIEATCALAAVLNKSKVEDGSSVAETNAKLEEVHLGVNIRNAKQTTPLHIAAKNGYLDIASELLSKGAEVDARNHEGTTALHLAVSCEHLDIVSLLLSRGADVNAKTNKLRTALHHATRRGCLDIVSLLLSKDADVNVKTRRNWTALQYAAIYGDLNIVSLLISKGVDVDAKNREEWTALHMATKHEHLDIVKLLLSAGANVNAQNHKKRTALHVATKQGHFDMVSVLLSKGATIDLGHYAKKTALHLGTKYGHLDLVSLFLSKGADVEAKDCKGWAALYYAARYDHLDIVEILLSNGADVNVINDSGNIALHSAAKHGRIDMVLLLLSKGANASAKNYANWTTLHPAAKSGHTAIASVLVSKGADVNAKTRSKFTALQFAAKGGHADIVSLLVSKGADVNAKTSNNSTALQFASNRGYTNIVALLLSKEADSNVKNSEGRTALHMAAKHRRLNIVSQLLSKGADIDAKTNKGFTALHFAANGGYLDIASLLLSRVVDVNAKTNKDATPLHLAARVGHLEIVSLLLSKDADVHAKTYHDTRPLHYAAKRGHLDMLSLFLSKGVDINVTNYKLWTALHFAANGDSLDVVSLLLSKEADINAKNINKQAPLYYAARKGYLDMVSLFLSKGADIKAVDSRGRTALYGAAKYGHSDTISLLLDNGADSEAASTEGCTPLLAAAALRQSSALFILLSRGANVEAKDNQNRTALHIAATKGRYNSVSLLLKNKVNVNETDATGKTALYYASKRGDIDTVSLLLDEGADLPQNDEDDYTELYNAVVDAELDTDDSDGVVQE